VVNKKWRNRESITRLEHSRNTDIIGRVSSIGENQPQGLPKRIAGREIQCYDLT
jgi:hypothetical protein